jgi:magnesium transporter
MSLDEIGKRDFFRVVWKEFRVSLLCAFGLDAVCFLKTMAIDFRFALEETLPNGAIQNNLMISLVVSITACCAVIFAKFIGTILPMGAKKIGLDPAVMASPFITTIVDTVTLVIYFAIASQVLGF